MKKFLVLGSLAVALLATGCSQKSTDLETSTDAMQNQQGYQSYGDGSGRDNFATIEDRIRYVEEKINNVYFDFDKFVVRADMESVVDNNASVLKSNSMGPLNIRIEGNTDEWGTDEYNYALGLKRAVAVKEALLARGIEESKTILVSYGESKPTCLEKTQECWAENRKVTFKALP